MILAVIQTRDVTTIVLSGFLAERKWKERIQSGSGVHAKALKTWGLNEEI